MLIRNLVLAAAATALATAAHAQLGPTPDRPPVAAKAGCGLVSELGAMRISEEIDATEVMGIRPIPFLVSTRLIAAAVVLPIIYTVGLIFAYWMFTQSEFVIGALCPWCLLVTLSTTFVFSTLTHVNIRQDNLFLPRRLQSSLVNAVNMNLDLIIVVIWVLALALTIVVKYGNALWS